MVTPPFNDPLSSLRLADTFYTWYRRTNDLVTKLNPLQIYGITAGSGGIEITTNTDGIATISSSIPYTIEGDHDFTGGITFSGSPITFNATSGRQFISYHGNADHNYLGGVDVMFESGSSVTFKAQCDVLFKENARVIFNSHAYFSGGATFDCPAEFSKPVTFTDYVQFEQSTPGVSFGTPVWLWGTTKVENSHTIIRVDEFEIENTPVTLKNTSSVDCSAPAKFTGELTIGGMVRDSLNEISDGEGRALISTEDYRLKWGNPIGIGNVDGDRVASKIVTFSPREWVSGERISSLVFTGTVDTVINDPNSNSVYQIITVTPDGDNFPNDKAAFPEGNLVGLRVTNTTEGDDFYGFVEADTGDDDDANSEISFLIDNVTDDELGGPRFVSGDRYTIEGVGSHTPTIYGQTADFSDSNETGYSDWGNGAIPNDATHLILSSWMNIRRVGAVSFLYLPGETTNPEAAHILHRHNNDVGEDCGSMSEVMVPLTSSRKGIIWRDRNVHVQHGHVHVKGYVAPANAAVQDTASRFNVRNYHFERSDVLGPHENGWTSDQGQLIGYNPYRTSDGPTKHMSVEIKTPIALRSTNAMVSVAGSIESSSFLRHEWEFWVDDIIDNEVVPTDFTTGDPLSKIVFTGPDPDAGNGDPVGGITYDNYESFAVDLPIIDVPNTGNIYLHCNCTLLSVVDGAPPAGIERLQNCWGSSYTWYGGGLGGVNNIAQEVVILPGDERISFADGALQKDTSFPGTHFGSAAGVIQNVVSDFNFPVDTTHINITAQLQDDGQQNSIVTAYAGDNNTAPGTIISTPDGGDDEILTMWVPVGINGDILISSIDALNGLPSTLDWCKIGVNGYMVNAGSRSSAVADRTVTLDKMWNLATQSGITSDWVGGLTFGGLHRVSDHTDDFPDQIKPLFGAFYDGNTNYAATVGYFNPYPQNLESPYQLYGEQLSGYGGTGSECGLGDSNLFRLEVNVYDDLGLDRSSQTITHVNLLSYQDDTLGIYHSLPTMMCPGKWSADNRKKSKIVNEVTGQNLNEAISGTVDIGESMSRGSFPVDENGDFTVWYPDISIALPRSDAGPCTYNSLTQGYHLNNAHMRAWVVVEGYVEEARVAMANTNIISGSNASWTLADATTGYVCNTDKLTLVSVSQDGIIPLGYWPVGYANTSNNGGHWFELGLGGGNVGGGNHTPAGSDWDNSIVDLSIMIAARGESGNDGCWSHSNLYHGHHLLITPTRIDGTVDLTLGTHSQHGDMGDDWPDENPGMDRNWLADTDTIIAPIQVGSWEIGRIDASGNSRFYVPAGHYVYMALYTPHNPTGQANQHGSGPFYPTSQHNSAAYNVWPANKLTGVHFSWTATKV